MKNYEKPALEETKIVIEGVYAGSGDESQGGGDTRICLRPNKKFRPHSNQCVTCTRQNPASACPLGYT